MRASFGGHKPYLADFEIADELSPDPFSEEPLPHSIPHPARFARRGELWGSSKIKNGENGSIHEKSGHNP